MWSVTRPPPPKPVATCPRSPRTRRALALHSSFRGTRCATPISVEPLGAPGRAGRPLPLRAICGSATNHVVEVQLSASMPPRWCASTARPARRDTQPRRAMADRSWLSAPAMAIPANAQHSRPTWPAQGDWMMEPSGTGSGCSWRSATMHASAPGRAVARASGDRLGSLSRRSPAPPRTVFDTELVALGLPDGRAFRTSGGVPATLRGDVAAAEASRRSVRSARDHGDDLRSVPWGERQAPAGDVPGSRPVSRIVQSSPASRAGHDHASSTRVCRARC